MWQFAEGCRGSSIQQFASVHIKSLCGVHPLMDFSERKENDCRYKDTQVLPCLHCWPVVLYHKQHFFLSWMYTPVANEEGNIHRSKNMTWMASGNPGEKCSFLPVIAGSQSYFFLTPHFCLQGIARCCQNCKQFEPVLQNCFSLFYSHRSI